MCNYIKTMVSMIMNRFDHAVAVEVKNGDNMRVALQEIANALRGDAQATDKNHHPKSTNER